jgi:3-isopropylmalate/(R)-2-methylmalate dehydratase small subunit
MQKFTTLSSCAAPLPLINVDTDMIIPKQFLRTIKRTGLGVHLFHDLRYDQNGTAKADFVLNMPPFHQAHILITRDNFGCGSSREHAPWALLDFGIRAIIAPSFADIFYNNCFKNGILPIVLSKAEVDLLITSAQKQNIFTIDLEKQIVSENGVDYHFEIDGFRKNCLLNGLDDIGLTLKHENAITAFEESQRKAAPWLYRS